MTDQLDLSTFIKKHKLPESYKDIARKWFLPMAETILLTYKKEGRPLVIGINGSQGSGKSTLADLLVCLLPQMYNISALSLSIDDFYFTREQREQLANEVHPLFLTRGVPGTHDVTLALETLHHLLHQNSACKIPRFDKSCDDRYPIEQWHYLETAPQIIILEGWCVGAEAQAGEDLLTPVNNLEADEDEQGIWRRYANQQLQHNYQRLFSQIDLWVMLKAPSFACVFDWRLEQEEKLKNARSRLQLTSDGIMNADDIARFIKHYQRITEHTLTTLPHKVHFLFELDAKRNIIRQSNRLN